MDVDIFKLLEIRWWWIVFIVSSIGMVGFVVFCNSLFKLYLVFFVYIWIEVIIEIINLFYKYWYKILRVYWLRLCL